jgi:predicted RNA-binding protein with PUA domain
MTGDLAIQYGIITPNDSQVMATVTCDMCGSKFQILHVFQFADAARVDEQAADFKADVLHGEHCDEKFVRHLNVYELD